MAAATRTIILLLILIGCTQQPSPVAEIFPDGHMRIGVDPSLPPFAFLAEGELQGIDIDLARALGERLGLTVQFVVLGYDGLYEALVPERFAVDVLISAVVIDPARMGDVLYTRHYFDNGLVLVTSSSSPITQMYDLSRHRLAFEFGSTADAESRAWERRIPPFASQPYELPDYALDAVRLGIADAALVEAASARIYRQVHPDWQAEMHYVTHTWYAAAVHISKPEVLEHLNATLQGLVDDGTLEQILDHWF